MRESTRLQWITLLHQGEQNHLQLNMTKMKKLLLDTRKNMVPVILTLEYFVQ